MDIEQLQMDQWYKVGDTDYYYKFGGTDTSTTYPAVLMTEFYSGGKKASAPRASNSIFWKDAKEATDVQLQKLLPKNHLDLQPKSYHLWI